MLHLGLSGLVPWVLYLTAIAVFFCSVFWKPEIGIFFIVPLFPLQTMRYKIQDFPLGNKLVDIILLGVLLGVMFRPNFKLKTPLNGFLLFYGIFCYASLFGGSLFLDRSLPFAIDDPRFSVWKNYMIMPLVFVLVTSVIKDVKQMKILLLLMCFTVLLADKSIRSDVGTRNLSHFSYDVRDGAVFGYAGANGAGSFEAQFSVFLLALAAYQKSWRLKAATIGLAIFGAYALMLTFSRGAYAAFLLSTVFLAVIKQRKILLVLIPFLLTWQLIVPEAVRERITMTHETSEMDAGQGLAGELDSSAGDRITIWEDATKLIPQYPLFGTGFDTYQYMHRVKASTMAGIVYADTHNYYLKVLVETGFIGLLFFLWLVFRMMFLGFRLYRAAVDPFLKSIGLGLGVAIIAAMVSNAFGDRWMFLEEMGYFWALLGCVVRGLWITQEAAQKQQEEEELGLEASPSHALDDSAEYDEGVLAPA